MLTSLVQYWAKLLHSSRNQIAVNAREYLKKRNVTSEIAKDWELGVCFCDANTIISNSGMSEQELVDERIISFDDYENSYYPTYSNRLIIPIKDPYAHNIALSGRALGNQKAKYINSPSTSRYRKGDLLFGLHRAVAPIRQTKTAILVEGQFDVIRMHSLGVTNTVAPLGTALTEAQISDLKIRCEPEMVILLPDGDKPAECATIKAIPMLINEGLSVFVVDIPKGEDADSFGLKHGREGVIRALTEASVWYKWMSRGFEEKRIRDLSGLEAKDAIKLVEDICGIAKLSWYPTRRDKAIHYIHGITRLDFDRLNSIPPISLK